MELFQTEPYVMLQSSVQGTFVHAAEDGRTIHLDATPQTSYNAVWAVERHHSDGMGYLRLRGVYGRYLGASNMIWSLFPCSGVAAMQCDFDKPVKKEILWEVSMVSDGTVELKSAAGPFLRTGVYFSGCRARHWKVHGVAQTSRIPREPSACVDKWRCTLERKINWVVAKRSGEVEKKGWATISFIGRDKIALENTLKGETKEFPMSLFLQAGSEGTLTPLYVNLPRSREPLDIIGLWGTAATDRLFFPNLEVGGGEMSVFSRDTIIGEVP